MEIKEGKTKGMLFSETLPLTMRTANATMTQKRARTTQTDAISNMKLRT